MYQDNLYVEILQLAYFVSWFILIETEVMHATCAST